MLISYQERSIAVSFVSNSLILAFYLLSIFSMTRAGGLESSQVFRLWGIVIVAGIVLNILGNILTSIVSAIIRAIQTQSTEEERYITDERDKLIELKGTKVSYIAFSLGVLIAMLGFVLGQPALVMFSLIVFFALTAQLIGDLYQLYLYHRGF